MTADDALLLQGVYILGGFVFVAIYRNAEGLIIAFLCFVLADLTVIKFRLQKEKK